MTNPILGTSVEDTLAYIHTKAIKKGTVEAYQTAIDEINGVWLLLRHTLGGSIPYYSLCTLNLQQELNKGLRDSDYRDNAKIILAEIHLEE